MDCFFERNGNEIICKYCGFKMTTNKDENKIFKKCMGAKKEYPSIYKMAENAVGAVVDFIRDGGKLVDENEQKRRLEICTGNQEKGIPTCENYDSSQNRCTKCGCFLALKTNISSGGCPIGKW